MIKDSGDRTEFSSGAVRDMHAGKGRFDLLPWYAIHEVAKHCEDGALKYGERNVDKGIPLHSLLDSAIRHLVKYIHGETDEPHLRAAAWNVLWALEQETTHPEMKDLPGLKIKNPFVRRGSKVTKVSINELLDMADRIFGVKPEIEEISTQSHDKDDDDDILCGSCRFERLDGDMLPCKVCCHNYTDKFEKAVNDE